MSNNLKFSRFFLLKSLKQNKTTTTSSSHQVVVSKKNVTTSAPAKATFNVQDEEDFKKRVVDNNKTVIVDFHATWCGPCKMLGPRLEKVMTGFDGKADFAKVDIDSLSDLAFDYKVNSVPTVIALKNGKEVGKFVGLMDDDKLKKFVKDAIEK